MSLPRFATLLLLLALASALRSERNPHGRARGKRSGRGLFSGRGRGSRGRARSLPDATRLCADTCKTARNGHCEDGGRLADQPSERIEKVECDMGADCADCGARYVRRPQLATLAQAMPAAPAAAITTTTPTAEAGGAVSLLRDRGVAVRAAWTRTQPPFVMAFTDPKADIDVSENMQRMRLVEPLYNLYWERLTAKCCADGGLVLDVGVNFGYYALYAARLGCRVVGWEPVPVFRAFVESAARLSNLSDRIHLRPAVLAERGGGTVTMRVPERGIWGTASVDGLNVDPSVKATVYTVTAPTETLDDVVREKACMMKLDVEGYEPLVLRGATRTLREYPPAAVLMEYTPGVIERSHQWERAPEYAASLRAFASAGYKGYHLEATAKNRQPWKELSKLQKASGGARPAGATPTSWASVPLPPLDEISEATLRAEEVNAANMAVARGSFQVPWELHPKSLHAVFAHNTDVLFVRDRDAIPRRADVGVTATSEFGLGGGLCRHTLRDGNAMEMIGRLCNPTGRNESIDAAVAAAEGFLAGQSKGKGRGGRGRGRGKGGGGRGGGGRFRRQAQRVRDEARLWTLTGKMHTFEREMVRLGS